MCIIIIIIIIIYFPYSWSSANFLDKNVNSGRADGFHGCIALMLVDHNNILGWKTQIKQTSKTTS